MVKNNICQTYTYYPPNFGTSILFSRYCKVIYLINDLQTEFIVLDKDKIIEEEFIVLDKD